VLVRLRREVGIGGRFSASPRTSEGDALSGAPSKPVDQLSGLAAAVSPRLRFCTGGMYLLRPERPFAGVKQDPVGLYLPGESPELSLVLLRLS
jgi:hypothetical protein